MLTALAALLILSGCETNAQRSARLARAARHHVLAREQGVVVGAQNPSVQIVQTQALHDQNGTAAIVRVRNRSSRPLRELPIAITLSDVHGHLLYQNNSPGLDPSLVSVGVLAPHGEMTWIDDQIPIVGSVAHVSARVGKSQATASLPLPRLIIERVHSFEDPSNGVGAEGTVLNHSSVSQQKLVVFAVARRAGQIVAAGRAILPQVSPSTATPFQVFFIGDPRGARVEVSAPPTTLR